MSSKNGLNGQLLRRKSSFGLIWSVKCTKTPLLDTRKDALNCMNLCQRLHSWGNALYGCPCSCRSSGLNRDTLISKGLRGVEVLSLAFNHASRHIHPRELLALLGFPPFMCLVSSCRAALCLLGNAVSPIPCIWIFAHLRVCMFSTLHACGSPAEVLKHYLQIIQNQLHCSWPPKSISTDLSLTLWHGGFQTTVAFKHGARIEHLMQAELAHAETCDVCCIHFAGSVMPFHAFLQPREYELIRIELCDDEVWFRIHYIVQVYGMSFYHVGRLHGHDSCTSHCCCWNLTMAHAP